MDFGLDLLTHNIEAKVVTVGVTVQLCLLTIISLTPFITAQPALKLRDVSWSAATAFTNVTSQVHRGHHAPQPVRTPWSITGSPFFQPEPPCTPPAAAWQLLTDSFLARKDETVRARVRTSSLRHVSLAGEVILNAAAVTHLK